jgi:hypothetical protein
MEWCGTECTHLFGATLGGLRPLGGLLGGLQLRLQVLQLARVLLVRLVDGLVDGLGKLHEHSAKLNVVWCGVVRRGAPTFSTARLVRAVSATTAAFFFFSTSACSTGRSACVAPPQMGRRSQWQWHERRQRHRRVGDPLALLRRFNSFNSTRRRRSRRRSLASGLRLGLASVLPLLQLAPVESLRGRATVVGGHPDLRTSGV